MKKKALVSSILTIALCVCLIAGSTLALFTSESTVNVAVTAGKVDVTATPTAPELSSTLGTNLPQTSASINEDGNVELVNIVPGDIVKFNIVIHNESTVTVKYRTIIGMVSDEDGLFEHLEVSIGEKQYSGTTVVEPWGTLEPKSKDITVGVEISLPESEEAVQGGSCELYLKVEAVQGNAPTPDEWDGETYEEPTRDDDGVYHITTAEQFAEYITTLNCGNASKYTSAKVVLENDIDLCGSTFEVSGEGYVFAGVFDGQGHTVSNYTIKRIDNNMYTGLFCVYPNQFESYTATIKNLTVKNGTVIGGEQVAAIVPSIYEGALVDNCHAIGCTVTGEKKVGAVVGYAQTGGTVSNCSAADCNIYASDERNDQASLFGYDNGGTFTNNDDKVGNTVRTGCAFTLISDGVALVNGVYEISNANGLVYCAETFNNAEKTNNKKFKLVADIDMSGIEWTPWCNESQYFNGRFNGDGHTISNLTIIDTVDALGHATGFIGRLGGGGADNQGNKTIENVTFVNAKVSGYHWVGVAVGYNEFGTMSDVKVIDSSVAAIHLNSGDACGDKAGAVCGFISPTNACEITNLSAENCKVEAARDAAQVIGFAYAGNKLSGITASNVTVTAVTGGCSHERAGIVSNTPVGNGTEAGFPLN